VALQSGKAADAAVPYQKGTAALDRALQLNADHPEALAIRAGTRLMMASFVPAPEMKAKLTERALVEMNRAVEVAPDSKRARLQRAFSGLTLPAELRNHATEIEDLDYLIREAGRSRAGDYTKLLRADLEFELGRRDEARVYYQQVSRSTSPAADMATTRLAALDQGGIAFEDIKALRSAAGAQCVMCHGE
jgi:tetratricopeptide (TPR) repeat protein